MARTNYEDFSARGPSYSEAWEILARGCEVPPSLEVFDAQLTARREGRDGKPGFCPPARPSLSVMEHARSLGEAYHRVRGFFDGNV